MDSTAGTTFRILRRGLVVFLFLFAVQLLRADDPLPYTLVVDPPSVEEGQTVRVSVVLDRIDPQGVQITEPPLPGGLELVRGPYIRPLLPGDGTVIEYALRAVSPGTYRVPGFTIRAGSSRTTTSGFRIVVRRPPEGDGGGGSVAGRRGSAPELPRFRWVTVKGPVQVNRPVPVFLAAEAGAAEADVDEVRRRKPEQGVLAVFEDPETQYHRWGGEGYAVEGFLYTPLTEGRAVIPGGSVLFSGGTSDFPPLEFETVSLPGGAAATGAVGEFNAEASLSRGNYSESGTAVLTIRITGTGNLPFLTIPDIRCEHAEWFRSTSAGEFEPTARGYSGYVEQSFVIRAEAGKVPVITVQEFPWFDPRTGEVRSVQEKILDLPRAPETSVQPDAEEKSEYDPLRVLSGITVGEIKKTGRRFPYRNPLMLILLAPGFFCFLGGFRKRKPNRKFRRAVISAAALIFIVPAVMGIFPPSALSGEQAEAADRITVLLSEAEREEAESAAAALSRGAPRHSGIWFLRFLISETGGDRAAAVKYLKRAQQLDPGDAGIGRAVRWYEEVEKVDLLNPSPPLSRPDMFFAAAVFLAAAAGAAFFVQKRRTSAGFAVLALCFAGLCLFSIQRSSRADAVVKEGGSLKRIPAEDSRVVREIETGTVVDITARTGIYRLIETGEKDEGWMEVTYLMEM